MNNNFYTVPREVKSTGFINRETIENNYLNQRIGAFYKPTENAVINSPDPKSSLYIPEQDRFNKDFASYDFQRRQYEKEKKRQRYENLRNILFDRERNRWERMDYEYLKNQQKVQLATEKNLLGRKNNPGMAFNPITLQYDNSIQGEYLKNRDDQAKYRAQLRANNLDLHFNSQYNLLTGEDRRVIKPVEKPLRFSHLN